MRGVLDELQRANWAFGTPRFYDYGNRPVLFTHFGGITAVPGGFNLAAASSAEASSMAFVAVTGGIAWLPCRC
jgi:hypothetical protein